MALNFLYDGYFAGKVGIGTETPDGELEIVTSTVVSGVSDTVNNVLIGLQAADRPTIILDTADTTYTNRTWNITNVGSAGKLFIGRNGLDVMVMDNDGNVGIGVTAPQQKLTLGSVSAGGIQFSYDSTDNYRHQILNYWNSNTDSRMDFNIARSSGQTPETIMSVGYGENVGIGTTSPSAKLEVSDATGAELRLTRDDSSIQPGDTIGTVNYYSHDADGQHISSFVRGHAGETYGRHGYLVFGTTDVNSTDAIEKMRIAANGNVGIGEDSPSFRLETNVAEAAASDFITPFSIKRSYATSSSTDMYTGMVWRDENTIQAGIYANRTNSASNYESDLNFYTNSGSSNMTPVTGLGTAKMVISSAGDVGIGTSSFSHFSTAKHLLVEGDVVNTNSIAQVISYDNLSSLAMYSGESSTDDPAIIYQNDLRFGSATSVGLGGYAERMRIDSSGNVGIGTASPVTLKSATTLQVLGNIKAGTTNDSGLISLGDIASTDANVGIWRGAAGAYAGVGNYLNIGGYDGITFTTGAADIASQTERMRITSAGLVGIGTTSPSSYWAGATSLVVYEAGHGGITIASSSSSYEGSLAFADGTSGDEGYAGLIRYNHTADYMEFYTQGSGRMTIGATGDTNIKGNITSTKTTPQLILEGRGSGNSGAAVQFLGWANSNANWQLGNAIAGAGFQIRASATVGDVDFATVATIAASTGVYTATSDVNRKKDFENSEIGLKEVMELQPKLFRMKTESEDTDKHLGFIAQEVKEVIPQAYVEQGEDNDKIIGLSQMPIIAALTNAIQELKAEIELLKQ